MCNQLLVPLASNQLSRNKSESEATNDAGSVGLREQKIKTFEIKLMPLTTPAGTKEEAGVAVVNGIDEASGDGDGVPGTEVIGA